MPAEAASRRIVASLLACFPSFAYSAPTSLTREEMGHNHPDQPAIQGDQAEVAGCAEVLRRSRSRAQTPAKTGLHGCEDELLPNVSKRARVQELTTDAGARTASQSPLEELRRERENVVFSTARGETLAVADREALLEARSIFGGLLRELSSSFAATMDGWS